MSSVAYYSKQPASAFLVSPLKPTLQLSDPGEGYFGFNHRFHTVQTTRVFNLASQLPVVGFIRPQFIKCPVALSFHKFPTINW